MEVRPCFMVVMYEVKFTCVHHSLQVLGFLMRNSSRLSITILMCFSCASPSKIKSHWRTLEGNGGLKYIKFAQMVPHSINCYRLASMYVKSCSDTCFFSPGL